MNRIKLIFTQTTLISSAILLGIGIQTILKHLADSNYQEIGWTWYTPISVILAGVLCSLPTLLLTKLDELKKSEMWLCICVHFILVGGVVSLCGFFFKWFTRFAELVPILIMYTIIYAVVWAASGWLAKSDEKKINDVIKNIQDKE